MWIFLFVLLGVMIFFICVFYYWFFNFVWWVFFFCFFMGLMIGLVFVNIVCVVLLIVDFNYREFCMGLVIFGELVGILIVSFCGIVVELVLRMYCFVIFKDLLFCFIRYKNYGWDLVVCFVKG